VAAAIEVLSGTGKRRGLRVCCRSWTGHHASVAYVDPGNFATTAKRLATRLHPALGGGDQQPDGNGHPDVVAKLASPPGQSRGTVPAESAAGTVSPAVGVMEIVAMALIWRSFWARPWVSSPLRLPLGIAGLLTAVVTFLLLSLERYGFRALNWSLRCWSHPSRFPIWPSCFWPGPTGGKRRFTPWSGIRRQKGRRARFRHPGRHGHAHVIFLHSALTQGRIVVAGLEEKKRLLRYQTLDVLWPWGWQAPSTPRC